MRVCVFALLVASTLFGLGCSEQEPQRIEASADRVVEPPPLPPPASPPVEPEIELRRARVTAASLGASWPFESGTTSVDIVCETAGPMMQWPGGARFALTREGARPGRPLLDPEIFNPDALKRGVGATQARAVLLARAETICS